LSQTSSQTGDESRHGIESVPGELVLDDRPEDKNLALGGGELSKLAKGARGRRQIEDEMRSLGWNVALAPNPATIRATGANCGVFVFFPDEEPRELQIRELSAQTNGKRERCIRAVWPGLEELPSPEGAARLLEEMEPGEQRRVMEGL
jgi:hypothetical protein